MSCCDHCTDAESTFTERAARRELRRYRRKGAADPTRELLDAIREQHVSADLLLDIGGGIGVLQHELLGEVVQRAVHVDASTSYLRASQEEATRRGHRDRVEYHHGDFVDIARDLPDADVVTLDRVICCYPDMPALVRASTAKARLLYAASYPRDRRSARFFVAAANLWFRMRRSSFRSFVHSPRAIADEIERQGFRAVAARRTFIWHAVVYRREAA
jgi:2-polyprenyl-3-methyl-5-hydroxy-6-metoxy-1,4-benzoquinol methylase